VDTIIQQINAQHLARHVLNLKVQIVFLENQLFQKCVLVLPGGVAMQLLGSVHPPLGQIQHHWDLMMAEVYGKDSNKTERKKQQENIKGNLSSRFYHPYNHWQSSQ
jgi:hypothetical protein